MRMLYPAQERTEAASLPALERAGSNAPLRVLLIEDNPDDVTLIQRLLRRGGYDLTCRQVQTAKEMEQALATETWDIVLSDYNLPQFDALSALAVLRRFSSLVPFIVISGSIGEETAVAAMRAGASDYLMKTNLARLLPAVERELREAAERRERTRTKKALADLQEKFQVIFREYLDVMMVIDAASGEILHVNHAASEVLGYDETRLVGQPFAALWSEAEVQGGQMLERVRRDGSLSLSGNLRRRDGSNLPMDMLANQVPWGRSRAIIVTLRDVSERRYHEQRLADEKEYLTVTLRSMGEGVITTDASGCVLLLNQVAERLTGWRQDEAAGQSLCKVLHLEYADGSAGDCQEQIEAVLRTGITVEISKGLCLHHRNGAQCPLGLNSSPIRGQDGRINGVVVIFRDTTVERKQEEELQKASRLESVGLLAGGIAHDFNNVLTAIMGHVSLAKAGATPPEAFVATVEKACLYASDLTRQLLTFAKGGTSNRQMESVANIVRESVEFSLHGSPLRCHFSLADNLHSVEVDRNQINQVLNNLVINAVQASPQGGSLFVSAVNASVTRDQLMGGLSPGEYVRIDVRDTGKGIEPEFLSRIFDPYFTTKSTGSGLGLSTSYSIIRNHGGLLQVDSEVGVGTTFSIYLPASGVQPAAESEKSAAAAAQTPLDAPGGAGRVLFMDDEEVLQELVGAMLNYLGYEVECASHGEQAVEMYAKSCAVGQPYTAVIVDLTVPGGMGGYEAVQRLRALDPSVKAIVSSGYSNDPIMADYQQHGFSGVIAKPYQLAELGEVLQGVIQAPPLGSAGGTN